MEPALMERISKQFSPMISNFYSSNVIKSFMVTGRAIIPGKKNIITDESNSSVRVLTYLLCAIRHDGLATLVRKQA
jgi:hypothetical protein